MKIMMLGGGTNQLCAINRIIENGHEVVVSDYLEQSPGKSIATYTAKADTFSYEETLVAAKTHKVDAILTVGTDQPVLTAAKVAKTLNLPSGISPETAEAVTNKRVMKKIFDTNGIPSVAYQLLNAQSSLKEYENFTYPAVLKPVDSQGQRGIFKVCSPDEIVKHLPETLSFSKTKEALLESYYENQEVTVSGWVKEGVTTILTMTDRVTFSEDERIGVCVSHEHPSIHTPTYGQTALELTEKIVDAFKIFNGPIYFQFLIGDQGMLVNEIACRIGGAYEDQFIPKITGFDILDAQLNLAAGQPVSTENIYDYDFLTNSQCVSVQLYFANPGPVKHVSSKNEMLLVEGVDDFRCHYKPGDEIPVIANASARVGFGLIYGEDESAVRNSIDSFFDTLNIRSKLGENLVIRGCRGNR